MARPKRTQTASITTATRIKTEAQRQMGLHGTAGLSLRAIARELGITAPAIYNYFPRLDDLITALIVDAFNALAGAMMAAREATTGEGCGPGIWAMVLAYRDWAVAHPIDFQLIYGNPIPGYHAPVNVTGPLARRPFAEIFRLFAQGYQRGELTIPAEYAAVPASVSQHLASFKRAFGVDMPDALYCLLISGWARMHGMVMLELFHHSQPAIGDPAAFYRYEMGALLARAGIPPPAS